MLKQEPKTMSTPKNVHWLIVSSGSLSTFTIIETVHYLQYVPLVFLTITFSIYHVSIAERWFLFDQTYFT